ncbi:MAG TPA: hypothetical protein VEL74_11260 [Thermoanaerobaculia bacterium]|nr:hypothetical protein [Thermoanaerobaculia bacterium]
MTRAVPSAALLLATLLVAGGALSQAEAPGQLQFARLNRTYSDVITEIEPIRQGPVTVRLSSPRHQLTVRNHLLRLEPGTGGSHSAELRVDFSGKGWLVADVDVAGMGGRLEDDVTVPAQSQTVEGRARVRKVAEGYLITPEQLPKSVRVRIQSGVGSRIAGFCDRAAALLFSNVDCGGLNRALSTAVVPLPAAGESYLLENAELTAAERQRIDSYLARESR